MKAVVKHGAGFGVVATTACVAVCTFPVLIGAGAFSGGLAALCFEDVPGIAFVLLAVSVVAFGVAVGRRVARRAASRECEPGGGC